MDLQELILRIEGVAEDDLLVLAGLLALTWFLRFVDDLLLHNRLNDAFCIQPRGRFRPTCFIIAPLLHAHRRHLFSNTLLLLPLAWLVMQPKVLNFWIVTGVAVVVSGLGTWLFGAAGTRHVGASGLVLSYFSYLLSIGFFERDAAAAVLGLALLLLATFFIGLVGTLKIVVGWQTGISATGHLFGFAAGILAAWLISGRGLP